MTELEKMIRAKMYLDKLADGIDPISDIELPNDSALNNVRLARCFFYVSDILRQVIDNGGVAAKQNRHTKKLEFELPVDKRSEICAGGPLSISDFIARINDAIDTDSMKKLSTTAITGWLLSKGFLSETELPSGKKTRLPSEQGEYIGLSTELRHGQYGDYYLVLYSEDARKFIIDNLESILMNYKNKSTQISD